MRFSAAFLARFEGISQGGSAKDVAALRWLWSDIDVGSVGHARPSPNNDESARDAVNGLTKLGVRPTVLVHSGGGLHAAYRLAEPIDVDAWSDLMVRLAGFLGGDLNVVHVEGVLRVAGTVNWKTAPRPVRLLSHADAAVTADTLFAMLPAVTEPSSASTSEKSPANSVEGHRIGNTVRGHASLRAGASRGRGVLTGRPFDLANDCPIDQVLAALGHEVHREGRYRYAVCPACGGTNKRKMVVGGQSNVACCFADCGRRIFSAVDLVVIVRGCTPHEAVDWLAGVFRFDGFNTRRS